MAVSRRCLRSNALMHSLQNSCNAKQVLTSVPILLGNVLIEPCTPIVPHQNLRQFVACLIHAFEHLHTHQNTQLVEKHATCRPQLCPRCSDRTQSVFGANLCVCCGTKCCCATMLFLMFNLKIVLSTIRLPTRTCQALGCTL